MPRFVPASGSPADGSVQTIQVCLNDLPATLWQAERAATWLRELLVVTPGREPPMSDMKRREFITLLGGAAELNRYGTGAFRCARSVLEPTREDRP